MKTSKIPNMQHEQAFDQYLHNIVKSDAYRRQRQDIERGLHPDPEWLHTYIWGQLSPEQARIIRNHLPGCAVCAKITLRLRHIKDEMEQRLFDWANVSSVATPLGAVIAEEYWQPVGAGEALVAASSAVTQEHRFSTPIGEINITCAWGRETADEPAFIWLSWNAEIPAERQFVIRLIEPEQQTIRYEIRPGTIHQGEQTFTSDTLGFDPVSQSWSLGVLALEMEET